MNYSIVYNGLQHYESCDFFGGDTGFKKRKILDNIKREYCNNNNIQQILSSSHHPSANGKVERKNREIRKKIKAGFIRPLIS